MSQPPTFTGSKIMIKVGDGADPEVFAHPCLINASRSIQTSATTVDSVIPDCADQEAPAWTEREKDALSVTITGEGVMDASSTDEYYAWLTQAAAKNIQAVVNNGGGANEYTLSGQFHLTEFQISGERKERAQVSITLVSTGPITGASGT